MSPGKRDTRRKRAKKSWHRTSQSFEITLKTSNDFVSGLSDFQKDVLVNRQLDDLHDDLKWLDEAAPNFVHGIRRAPARRDLATKAAIVTASELILDQHQVMQIWQMPLMKALAEIVAATRGDILEIGFGMGICASFIQ